jgi:dynein heavy chain 1
MKIQGEYIVKLRELEDSLLDALSNVQGSILESESVISTLEKLKTEATKITEEMKRSDEVMGEVDSVTNGYRCIAEASSKIFFALQSMSGLHYLYEYSLNFFMDTVMKLLESEDRLNKISKKDYDLRKDAIHNLLFEKIFQRVSNSLLSNDLLILSLKLVHIKLPENLKELFGLLIKPATIMNTKLSKHLLEGLLTEEQLKQIEEISSHEFFSDLLNTIENNEGEWMKFLIANNPEEIVPDLKVDCNEMTKKFINLILIKIFRPDKFSPVAYETVKEVLGEECKEGLALDLKNVVANCKSKEPILLSSAPGFDPSYKV